MHHGLRDLRKRVLEPALEHHASRMISGEA